MLVIRGQLRVEKRFIVHVHFHDVLDKPEVQNLHDLAAEFRIGGACVRLAKFLELLLDEAMLSFVFRQARVAALFEQSLLACEMRERMIDEHAQDATDGMLIRAGLLSVVDVVDQARHDDVVVVQGAFPTLIASFQTISATSTPSSLHALAAARQRRETLTHSFAILILTRIFHQGNHKNHGT